MLSKFKVLAALSIAALAANSANAAISLAWTPVVPNATAIGAGAGAGIDFTGLSIYDLRVTSTGGSDTTAIDFFASGSLLIAPDNDPSVTGDDTSAFSRISTTSVNSPLHYVTAVQTPRFTAGAYSIQGNVPTVAGGFNGTSALPAVLVTGANGSGGLTSYGISFFDTAQVSTAGTYTVVRLAFYGNNPTVAGTVRSRIGTVGQPNVAIPALPVVVTGPSITIVAGGAGSNVIAGGGTSFTPANDTDGTPYSFRFQNANTGSVVVALDFGNNPIPTDLSGLTGFTTVNSFGFSSAYDVFFNLGAQGTADDGNFTVDLAGIAGVVGVGVVPEPTSMAVLGMLALPALRRSRRA